MPLLSFSAGTALQFFLVFHKLIIFELCRLVTLQNVPQFVLCTLGRTNYISNAQFFSVHLYQEARVTVYLITGDINFDSLVSMVSARFVLCKVTVFPHH